MPESDAHPRAKYYRQHEMSAVHSFKDHQIVDDEWKGRWLLKQPKNGFCWTEIICTRGRGLYIDGDIEPVVFRYGPEDFQSRLRWMGGRKHAWDHYFREKAHIGMGGPDAIETWKSAIALAEVDDLIAETINDNEDDLTSTMRSTIYALNDVVKPPLRYDDCTRDEFLRDMSDLELSEEAMHMGVVPTHRMFSAHAALQRLVAILDARKIGTTP